MQIERPIVGLYQSSIGRYVSVVILLAVSTEDRLFFDTRPTLDRHSPDIPLRLSRRIPRPIQAEYRQLYRPICRSTLDRHVSVDSIGRRRPIVNMIQQMYLVILGGSQRPLYVLKCNHLFVGGYMYSFLHNKFQTYTLAHVYSLKIFMFFLTTQSICSF